MNRHPTGGQGHIAFLLQQALTGEVDGNQRGGTRGLHRNTGTGQIEFVGDLSRQIVRLIAQHDAEAVEGMGCVIPGL